MSQKKDIISEFTSLLLDWYDKNRRDLPWRKTKDPYQIMVSEFMLQQTQVVRVVPKYKAFLERFPDIESLACANLSDVLMLWQGLGYNRRAKFLLETAKQIVMEHKGVFPKSLEELRKLPGFGPYTAGAVYVFSYNKPAIVIDANVKNVFNKVFGISDADIPRFVELAVPQKRPRDFYNALMDVGSKYYKSASDYSDYPFNSFCAFVNNKHVPDIKKTKQKKFHGSNRYYRGQILKMLCENAFLEKRKFALFEPAEKYAQAAEQLLSEKLITETDGSYRLP